ncbi:MAG: hypothetical protein WD801_13890 [Gemmatimonadaceae bacterium]
MIRIGAVLALAAAGTAAACVPARQNGDTLGGATQSPVGQSADTLVGVVARVGSDPVSWMAITPPDGGQLRLSGTASAALGAVAGAHVWVTGARESSGFRVDAFEVRRVNGQPVDDGVVVVTSSDVAIRTRSGMQRTIPNAPPSMRELAGARVWVSQPVGGVAPSYGLISRP